MRITVIVARLVVGVAIVAAIVAQLIASVAFANRNGDNRTADVIVNFLSYFTIDSNTISAVILLAGAAILARGVGREPRGFTVARMAVATYMIITGVVYNLLLRSSLAQGATVAWSNEVLHVVAPVYLALDWFLAPGRNPMTRRDALLALVFPVIWLVYTMVRGPSATDPYTTNTYWYPYPFLNPVTSAGGYAQVSGFIVGIALVVVAVAYGLAWSSRRLARETSDEEPARTA